jgi:hypothetical protein
MNINIIQTDEFKGVIDNDYHLLSVAETGFNRIELIKYGENCGVNQEKMKKFLSQVNTNDESGSLHPVAPISAIPKKYFWDEDEDAQALTSQVEDFLRANQTTIKATKLLLDFGFSMRPFVIDACKLALENQDTDNIDEVVIVNRNYQ